MVFSHLMESGEVKDEQRQPVLPPKKSRKRPKPEKSSAQANGGSSSSAAESSLTRTSSSSPPGGDADGKGQQQQHHKQGGGGGGKRPRLVWTAELHDLFVEAYDSLGDEAVPRRILEKMNVPELSREKVASHLQKHKLHLRRLAEEASSHSPTEKASASHPLRSLPTNTTPLAAEASQAQIELVQVLQQTPPDCLSRSSSSSIAANVQIVQSIQQQFLGPPIKEGQAQPAETLHMQRAPADSGFSPVGMETSTAAILVPEANTEEAVIPMVQAAEAENAAEPEEAAPAPGSILGQFWASPDNEASCTSSWDIFVLSRGT